MDNKKSVKKVLWFSRHEMTPEQREALGDCEITQVSKSISSAYELADEIKEVITALNNRVLVKQDNGEEEKAVFHFVKWERLVKVEVVTEDFVL